MNSKNSNPEDNYTTYIKELFEEITNNIKNELNEDIKTKIKDNIANINWEKHFERTCQEILKHGKICSTIVKPGHDYCQRHLTINLIRKQKEEEQILKYKKLINN